MKKFLVLAGICLAMCAGCMAQEAQNQRQGGQRMRRQMDAVVDTAVINHMDLKADVLQKVYTLQEAKQAEQKAQMEQMKGKRGQRPSDEERKAMQEKRQAFTAQYRKELRAILGDANYIAYLEKMLDRQGMRMMGGGPRMQGQGQRGGQQQGQMPQGGFPEGGFE